MEAIIVNGRKLEAHQVIDGVLVNPIDPPLGKLDMIRRSVEDLELWRRRPFIIQAGARWKVMCLDGRFRNGATVWAVVDDMEQALAAAKEGWLHPEGAEEGAANRPKHPEGAEGAVKGVLELLGGNGGSYEAYPLSKSEEQG